MRLKARDALWRNQNCGASDILDEAIMAQRDQGNLVRKRGFYP
jgi:hypothetical protein